MGLTAGVALRGRRLVSLVAVASVRVMAHLETPRGDEARDPEREEECHGDGSVPQPSQRARPQREEDGNDGEPPLGLVPDEKAQAEGAEGRGEHSTQHAVCGAKAASERADVVEVLTTIGIRCSPAHRASLSAGAREARRSVAVVDVTVTGTAVRRLAARVTGPTTVGSIVHPAHTQGAVSGIEWNATLAGHGALGIGAAGVHASALHAAQTPRAERPPLVVARVPESLRRGGREAHDQRLPVGVDREVARFVVAAAVVVRRVAEGVPGEPAVDRKALEARKWRSAVALDGSPRVSCGQGIRQGTGVGPGVDDRVRDVAARLTTRRETRDGREEDERSSHGTL